MKLQTLDARGMACPQPVIQAKNALKELSGGALKVLVDNEAAVQNLMRLGGYLSCEPVWEKEENGDYSVIFTVADEPGTGEGKEELTQNAEEKPEVTGSLSCKKGQVAVFSSDCMGSGSKELGLILMKGFLYALTQLDELPETVVLYNGGAKLSKKGEESVKDLQELAQRGVNILTCGTCLDYYGLPSRPAVGGVTNLYEIAELLSRAVSVIKP